MFKTDLLNITSKIDKIVISDLYKQATYNVKKYEKVQHERTMEIDKHMNNEYKQCLRTFMIQDHIINKIRDESMNGKQFLSIQDANYIKCVNEVDQKYATNQSKFLTIDGFFVSITEGNIKIEWKRDYYY